MCHFSSLRFHFCHSFQLFAEQLISQTVQTVKITNPVSKIQIAISSLGLQPEYY